MGYDPWNSWPWGYANAPSVTLKWWEYAIAVGAIALAALTTFLTQPWTWAVGS